MKKTNNVTKVLFAVIALLSVAFLNSCSKNIQDKAVQNSSVDDGVLSTPTPIAVWNFDSSWAESVQNLVGVPHQGAKFAATAQAHDGSSAFKSPDSGYVSYDKAGTALGNITQGLTVDFWLFAYPKEGGAQCVWCLPQTGGQFWPDMHVLLDGYNSAQKDSGLIKVMFKANKAIPYNEQWTQVSGIPKFYKRWTHVQYSYNGNTSKYTLIINGHTYFDHVILYDSGDSTTRQPLGKLVANPGKHGVLFGAFQNQWDPSLFGDPQPWMLGFNGRVDQFKVYNKAIF